QMLALTPDAVPMLYNLAKALERENRTDNTDKHHRIRESERFRKNVI
ncbi:unnamed protein product, partial [marine sediment metagenome]